MFPRCNRKLLHGPQPSIALPFLLLSSEVLQRSWGGKRKGKYNEKWGGLRERSRAAAPWLELHSHSLEWQQGVSRQPSQSVLFKSDLSKSFKIQFKQEITWKMHSCLRNDRALLHVCTAILKLHCEKTLTVRLQNKWMYSDVKIKITGLKRNVYSWWIGIPG